VSWSAKCDHTNPGRKLLISHLYIRRVVEFSNGHIIEVTSALLTACSRVEVLTAFE
jgi:heme oxygenase